MTLNESELVFASIAEEDMPELTRVMTRAFDDDAQKHLGQERRGPPGYDNGDFFRKWLFGYDETDGHSASRGGLRMQTETQEVSNCPEAPAPSYFDLQATWGVTKHFGGTDTTDALAALCGIGRDAYVLDVGCGTGMTPCYLAGTVGCRVVAVDLSERMITWTKRRVLRAQLDDRVTCTVADAQKLPFPAGTFDAVICESVTAFVPDRPQAVREYTRVVRSGGSVGMAEGIWLAPPPVELAAYLARVMAGGSFLTLDAWSSLLADAGLTDLVAERSTISARRQWKSELARLDREERQDYLQAWKKFGSLLVTSAPFRRYLRELWPPRSIFQLFDYFGYGIFVGRKSMTRRES
jgi:arsenite methyltransferase